MKLKADRTNEIETSLGVERPGCGNNALYGAALIYLENLNASGGGCVVQCGVVSAHAVGHMDGFFMPSGPLSPRALAQSFAFRSGVGYENCNCELVDYPAACGPKGHGSEQCHFTIPV